VSFEAEVVASLSRSPEKEPREETDWRSSCVSEWSFSETGEDGPIFRRYNHCVGYRLSHLLLTIFAHGEYIYLVSWAQLVQEKVAYVLPLIPQVYFTLTFVTHQFINIITGVGHNLESCTSKVSAVRLPIPEMAFGDLVFIDTPGFDDTHKSEVDILKMVADWLRSTYVFVCK
jgi:hypothetical protein